MIALAANMTMPGALPPFTLDLWRDVVVILSYDFMRRALLTATALAIVSGLVGYFTVLRRQAFAGEALADVAFTGALGGAAFGLNIFASLIGVTVAAGLVMGWFGERLRGRDIAIGTTLAWTLGLGALFLTLFNSGANATVGVTGVSALFGNLLGVTAGQTQVIVIAAIIEAAALVLIARPLLFASLDPDVARARGVQTRALGLGFMALLAVTVSLATLAVGALLVFALLLLPAAAAQRLAPRPYAAMGLASLLAVFVAWLGIAISFYSGIPGSVCVSLLGVALYAAVFGYTRLRPAR
ncbi:MAG TPA: metal ABC transporter permease [Ktedonobacterales bacterium]